MKLQLLMVVMMTLLGTCVPQVSAIPSRVANRMIPSWWLTAREKRNCDSWTDCNHGECCTRPMLSSHSYCLPFKSRGQSCDASAMLLDFENEVYFDHCPCQKELTCANLHTSSVCLDTESLEHMIADNEIDHNRPAPKPVKL